MSNGQDLVAVSKSDLETVFDMSELDIDGFSDCSCGGCGAAQRISHALSRPSVTVVGEIEQFRLVRGLSEKTDDEIEASLGQFPTGPCTVTITPKGGQSGE